MNCSVSLFNNQYLSLHIKKSNYSDEIYNIIKYHMKTSQIIITQLSHTKKGFNTNYTDSSIALRLWVLLIEVSFPRYTTIGPTQAPWLLTRLLGSTQASRFNQILHLGATQAPYTITQAKSKAIQPWHYRMPHTSTTHRPFRSISEQQVYSNGSITRLHWTMT